MDPAEVRRRNLVTNDRFPFTTTVGTEYDTGDYERALDLVLEAAGYQELRAEQQAPRASRRGPKQLGIGGSIYVEITNYGGSGEFGALEVKPDGTAEVRTGTSPHGQGHETAWAMLASEQTGIPIDKIKVIHGDTDLVPTGGGTAGSRSLQAGGVAVHQAAVQLVDKAKQLAAELLEANPDDLVLDKVGGRFHVAGTPGERGSWAGASWPRRRTATAACGPRSTSPPTAPRSPSAPTWPWSRSTPRRARSSSQRMVAVDDAGRILNPLLAEGQVHGGLAQGVAQALLEEVRYDEDGNPVTSNLADYAFISAAELPSFETVHMETPTPVNELGAKGIGESGTIGSTPAVQNAVVDALSHLGVRHVDMPATPERVWRAIGEATASRTCDMMRRRWSRPPGQREGLPDRERHEAGARRRAAAAARPLHPRGRRASPAPTSAATRRRAAPAPCMLDGESVKSCTVLAVQADGADITTIEGLAPSPTARCTRCRRRSARTTACSAASARPAW